jgi:uncharacterized protein YhaN
VGNPPGKVRRRRKTGWVLRPEGEWQGTVERPELAIVDPELWAQANRMRAVNRQTSPRNARAPSLLHGLVYCEGDHGDGQVRKMTLKVPKGERPRWRCPWKAAPGGPYCQCSISAPVLEDLVWAKLVALAEAPERVLASMAAGLQEMGARRRRAAGRLAAAQADVAKHEATLDALTVRWLSGDIGDEQYRRLKPALEDAVQVAARAREEAAAQVRELEEGLALDTGLEGLARLVRHAFAHGLACDGQGLGEDERRREIKRVVDRIIVAPEGPVMVVALTGEREALVVNTASHGCGARRR